MKSEIKLVIVFVLGFFLIGTGTSSGETLKDAIKAVLETNPDITSTVYNRLARDQEVNQAKADFYPKLDTSGSFGLVDQQHPDYDKFRPRAFTVRVSQNVFRGGATLSETNRQKARAASEAYLIQSASENTALLACRVYLNYLRAIEMDTLAKENLTIHERLYDQIRLRSQAGVDRKVDLEQITARMALAKSNLVTTAANIQNARTDYQAVIGHMPDNPVKPEPFDLDVPANMDNALKMALDNHPTLKSARADIEARRFQNKTAKAMLWPVIDIGAEYTTANDLNGPINFFHYQDYFLINAMARFNIFNGGLDAARIKETSYLVNEAEEIAKRSERQTVQALRLSYEAYMADQRRIAQLEQYVSSTGTTADAFVSQWSIGRRTLFDVLDTQAETITAKQDLITAQYEKMYDSFRILNAIGRLVNSIGLQWPEESRVKYESDLNLRASKYIK